MVKKTGVMGCCAASLYFDLGSVHGIPRKKDQEEFDKSLLDTYNPASMNIAICNSYQVAEMKYLETQGWKKVYQQGNLHVYIVNYNDLINYKIRRTRNKQKKVPIDGKVTLQWVIDLMGSSPLTTIHHGHIANTFRVAIPHSYIGTRDVDKVFNSIKSRVALRKKKKGVENHGIAIAA